MTTEKGIKITTRTCIECGKTYEAHEAQILGMRNPIVFGGGRCKECAKKKMEAEELRETQMRDLELKTKREDWRTRCGIPIRFMKQRFDTFQPNRSKSLSNAFKDCVDYADKFPLRGYHGYRSLVLYSEGVWGVGKSHLAASIGHRIFDRWVGDTEYCPVRYTSEPNLFLRIRNTFNRQTAEEHHETETEVYRELTTVPLLIIDDMGKEEVSDPRFVQRVLFTIINGRYDNMLPVVITANLNTDRLEKHLGGDRGNSATFDRITEMTGNIFRQIIATTYRDFSNRVNK
jgi:DNA replication protein DnaC